MIVQKFLSNDKLNVLSALVEFLHGFLYIVPLC